MINIKAILGRKGTILNECGKAIHTAAPKAPINDDLQQLLNDNTECFYCGARLPSNKKKQGDHVIPVIVNQQPLLHNMGHVTVPCCSTCNSQKSNKFVYEFLKEKSIKPSPKLQRVLDFIETGTVFDYTTENWSMIRDLTMSFLQIIGSAITPCLKKSSTSISSYLKSRPHRQPYNGLQQMSSAQAYDLIKIHLRSVIPTADVATQTDNATTQTETESETTPECEPQAESKKECKHVKRTVVRKVPRVVEKVIKSRDTLSGVKCLVRWKRFNDKHDRWIQYDDLTKKYKYAM